MEQEVNIKTVCIATRSAEKAASVFKSALMDYIGIQKRLIGKNHTDDKKTHTSRIVKVKDLRKDGSMIELVDMSDEELKNFRRFARRYGVSYAMEKNKDTDPPTYLIFLKANDRKLINRAVDEYVSDNELKTISYGGLKQKLLTAKDMMNSHPKKVRKKEHIR